MALRLPIAQAAICIYLGILHIGCTDAISISVIYIASNDIEISVVDNTR